jgi:predicted nucleic acid-binding protein
MTTVGSYEAKTHLPQLLERVARGETLHLARLHNLSLYDAAYLELAVRRGLPLATLDDKLKGTAAAVGVPEFEP